MELAGGETSGPRTVEDSKLPDKWFDDYQKQRSLHGGGDSRVRVMKHSPTGKLFVVKTLVAEEGTQDGKKGYCIPDEVMALGEYLQKHVNIVEFYGYASRTAPHGTIFCDFLLEYCNGGDLWAFLKHWREMRRYVPLIFILHYMASMIDALAFLHWGRGPADTNDGLREAHSQYARPSPIIHGDIKPANIFLRWSSNNKYDMPDIVLGDFGFAVPAEESLGTAGTPGYLPPEVKKVEALKSTDPDEYKARVHHKIMTAASDVYTFGAVLYEVITGQNFNNQNSDHVPPNLEWDFARSTASAMPMLLNILQACLAEVPTSRHSSHRMWWMTPALKQGIEFRYGRGERHRMPADGFKFPAPSPSSEDSNPVDEATDPLNLFTPTNQAINPPQQNTDNVAETDIVSQASPSSVDYCHCPNHRAVSENRYGPNCI